MTKKLLLKWLDQQKEKALATVIANEAAAKEALLAEKTRACGLEALAAEIEPKLSAVYDAVAAWHKEHEAILGRECAQYNSVRSRLAPLIDTSRPLLKVMQTYEFARTQADEDLKRKFAELQREVERTYNNVSKNAEGLANAKLGMEYLQSLGFDLTTLLALDEKPMETALACPINVSYLLLPKEA